MPNGNPIEPMITRTEAQEAARRHLRASIEDGCSPADARDLSVAAAALASVLDDLPESDKASEFLHIHWTVIDRWWRDIEVLLQRIYDATSLDIHGRGGQHAGATRFIGDRVYYRLREGIANELRERLEKLPPELREKWWEAEDEVRELARDDQHELESQASEITKRDAIIAERDRRIAELEARPTSATTA